MNKPNVLFILCDQLRWDGLSCTGNWADTPNIDAIAQEGMIFNNCVTSSPVCIPARLSLATGHYPHSTGIWNNLHYDMPGKSGIIGHDNVIAEHNIVCNMAIAENVIVGSHDGLITIIGGGMNRHRFTKGVMVTNPRARCASLPFQVLGFHPDGGEGENFISPQKSLFQF